MMTPTRIIRAIGILGLIGWLGLVGWVAKTTRAQNGAQAPAVSAAPAPAPAPTDAPAPANTPKPPPPPLLPTRTAPPTAPVAEAVAPPTPDPIPEPPVAIAVAPDHPGTSGDDPEKAAKAFVERNRKEAETHLKALTTEAEQLRGRLQKLESGIKRWQALVQALEQSERIAGGAEAAPATEATDLEPIPPGTTARTAGDRSLKPVSGGAEAPAAGAEPAAAATAPAPAEAPAAAQPVPQPAQAPIPR